MTKTANFASSSLFFCTISNKINQHKSRNWLFKHGFFCCADVFWEYTNVRRLHVHRHLVVWAQSQTSKIDCRQTTWQRGNSLLARLRPRHDSTVWTEINTHQNFSFHFFERKSRNKFDLTINSSHYFAWLPSFILFSRDSQSRYQHWLIYWIPTMHHHWMHL